jgi:hypothetical protein
MYRAINVIALPAAALNRKIQADLMSLWRMMTPAEPNRVLLMRTLARGTTIVGRMLDGIVGGSQLSVAGKWITSIGRALWGLVEISVPRRWLGLLWRYWNSLFLLIAIMLIAAGLVTALPAISGFGRALLAFTGLVLVLRTILWDFMRAGRWRAALAGIAIVISAGIFLFGLWEFVPWSLTGGWQ